jgi:4-hydroxy-tetrahydrodipicolinate reductase
VDFSVPDVALTHLRRYASWPVPAVVGTTGWHEHLADVRAWLEAGGGTVLHAANFSLGVALVVRALRGMLPLADRLAEYDVAVHEAHHVRKLDSPSGTALRLADELLAGLARKTRVEGETVHGEIAPEALHVTSQRVGHAVGVHTVRFDSADDEIEITHRAASRRAFASGAVTAAEWLASSDRHGLLTLDDWLDDWTR